MESKLFKYTEYNEDGTEKKTRKPDLVCEGKSVESRKNIHVKAKNSLFYNCGPMTLEGEGNVFIRPKSIKIISKDGKITMAKDSFQ
jgi:hypothetical protein